MWLGTARERGAPRIGRTSRRQRLYRRLELGAGGQAQGSRLSLTLPKRMLHNRARCFIARMGKVQDYASLRPVVAIRILERDLFPDRQWFHAFSSRDAEGSDYFDSWLPEDELDPWLYFLTQGQELDPEALAPGLRGTTVQEALEAMAAFTKYELARRSYWKRRDVALS